MSEVAAAVKPGRLWIGGAYVDAEGGKTFDVLNPATEETITTCASATPADVDRAVQAARAAFPRGRRCRRSSARDPVEHRRAPDGPRRRARDRRDADERQADLREQVHRHARRGEVLPVLRRLGDEDHGPDDPAFDGTVPELHAARAARCRRRDRGLELPAAARVVEGRARARRRQHGRAQAGRVHAAVRAACSPSARRRPAGRRAQRRAGQGLDRGPGAGRAPGRGEDRVHRVDRGRQGHPAHGRGARRQGHDGARRQEREHRLCGREHRRRRARRGERHLLRQGRDLRRRLALLVQRSIYDVVAA